MKLTKETRNEVKIGTILKGQYDTLMVSNMWSTGRCTNITLKILEIGDPNQKCWEGHMLYGRLLSEYYGFEIVN